jgi:hypothetical protein
MFFRRYQVVGPCYVHGISAGEALLGPLPSNLRWVESEFLDPPYDLADAESGELVEDPRPRPPHPVDYQPEAFDRELAALQEWGVKARAFERSRAIATRSAQWPGRTLRNLDQFKMNGLSHFSEGLDLFFELSSWLSVA